MKKLSEMRISEMLASATDGMNLFIEEDFSSENNGDGGKDAAPNKENNEMDKREAIREIMAISAKPVSEFKGGEEEKVETVSKLAEKIAYSASEAGTNDEAPQEEEKNASDACAKDEDVDKRKLIDEIGGILKGKLSEELWRTVIGKAEKLAYNKSEASANDEDPKSEKETKEDSAKAMDGLEKELIRRIERKGKLAERLKPFIGVFDHADMTEKEMAVYACEKLGKKVAQDEAVTFINGYLEAAKPVSANVVMDEAPAPKEGTDEAFTKYLKGE